MDIDDRGARAGIVIAIQVTILAVVCVALGAGAAMVAGGF